MPQCWRSHNLADNPQIYPLSQWPHMIISFLSNHGYQLPIHVLVISFICFPSHLCDFWHSNYAILSSITCQCPTWLSLLLLGSTLQVVNLSSPKVLRWPPLRLRLCYSDDSCATRMAVMTLEQQLGYSDSGCSFAIHFLVHLRARICRGKAS